MRATGSTRERNRGRGEAIGRGPASPGGAGMAVAALVVVAVLAVSVPAAAADSVDPVLVEPGPIDPVEVPATVPDVPDVVVGSPDQPAVAPAPAAPAPGQPAAGPTPPTPEEAAAGRTVVRAWGDSILNSTRRALRRRLVPEARVRVRAVDGSPLAAHLGDIATEAATGAPDRVLVGLGTNDARLRRSPARMRQHVRAALDSLRDVPCVVWVTVKEFGVHPFYRGVVAHARRFNEALRTVGAEYPNVRIADHNRWARRHRSAYLADGLHLRPGAGTRPYADFLQRHLDACGP